MANYNESKIYKIYSNSEGINEIYVGSSARFIERCEQHRSDCYNINSPRYILKLYNYIRSNGGFNNFIIQEIEHYSCNNRTELNIREEYWKAQLNPTLNIIKAHITKEELKQYKKDYQQQEHVKEYLKTIIRCPKCNKEHTRRDTTHHQNTKYCKNFK